MIQIKNEFSKSQRINILDGVLLVIIIALPLWPSYLNVKVPSLPNISPTRVIIFLGILLWVLAPLINNTYRKYFFDFFKEYRNLIFLIMLPFFGWKLVTAGVSPNRTQSFFAAFNNLIYCLGLFVMAANIWQSYNQLKRVVRVLLLISIVIFSITVIEAINQENLFVDFVPDTFISAQRLREGIIRDNTYRAWGTFAHPIALAGYCTTVLPLVVWDAYVHHRNRRLFSIFVGFFLAVTLYLSTSRAGLVVFLFMFCGVLIVNFFPRWISRKKNLGKAIKVLMSLFLSMLIIFAVLTVVKQLVTGRTTKEAGSSAVRLIQLELGLPLIKEKPITGYGPGRAAIVLGLKAETVDNYYLSLALESGLPEVFLFIIIYLYFLRFAWKLHKRSSKQYSGLALAIFWLTSGNALFLSVVSLEQTIPFVFLMFGMLISIKNMNTRKKNDQIIFIS